MPKRAIPVEGIEARIAEIDARLAALAELQKERALLVAILGTAVDVEPPAEVGPEEAATLTGKIIEIIEQFPDITSGAVARYVNVTGMDASVKVVQTIIGQQVKKGVLSRSASGELRVVT